MPLWKAANDKLVRAFRGDIAGANAAFDELAELVTTSEYVHDRSTYYAERALVSLVAGDLHSAYEEAEAAVAADPSGINSPKSLAMQARVALWLHDSVRVVAALAGMGGFRGRWMATAWLTTEAGLAALEGRSNEAIALYERARRLWNELGTPLDLALCEMDVAFLLAPHQAADDAADKARQLLREIGSPPLLAQLEVCGPQVMTTARSGDETA